MIPVANKLIYYLRQPQLNFEHDDRQNIFTLRCNLAPLKGDNELWMEENFFSGEFVKNSC